MNVVLGEIRDGMNWQDTLITNFQRGQPGKVPDVMRQDNIILLLKVTKCR